MVRLCGTLQVQGDAVNTILIISATLTGMTEEIAHALHEQLVQLLPDREFAVSNIRDLSPEQLQEYSTVILGTSTWDHGIPPPDGEEFLSELAKVKPDLSGVTFALFGLGESVYPLFCGALSLFREDLEACGATVLKSEFTLDGYPSSTVMAELAQWAKQSIESL
jgi:flavodoxin I